jgi:hypothetical protein
MGIQSLSIPQCTSQTSPIYTYYETLVHLTLGNTFLQCQESLSLQGSITSQKTRILNYITQNLHFPFNMHIKHILYN